MTRLSQSPPPENPVAGWNPDPLGVPNYLRWWDGDKWTGHTHPGKGSAPAPAQDLTPKTDGQRKEILNQRVAVLVASGGYRLESQTDFQAIMATGKRTNHILHLILSIITLGLWIPVWIILSAVGGEKRKVIQVDGQGQLTES